MTYNQFLVGTGARGLSWHCLCFPCSRSNGKSSRSVLREGQRYLSNSTSAYFPQVIGKKPTSVGFLLWNVSPYGVCCGREILGRSSRHVTWRPSGVVSRLGLVLPGPYPPKLTLIWNYYLWSAIFCCEWNNVLTFNATISIRLARKPLSYLYFSSPCGLECARLCHASSPRKGYPPTQR